MKRVLIATEKPFAPSALSKISEVIKQAGYEVNLLEKYQSKAELLDAVKTTDALIVRSDKVDRDVLDAAENLKIVVRAGAGYDNVDTTYAKEKAVVVMNTPGQNSNAVAELAIGLAIYGIREFFSGKSGGELRGRTLGLHGYGYVARNVHRIARGFGMKVIVYTRYSKAQATSEGLEVTGSLEELYALSDVVSIHVPAKGEHLKSVSMDILKHLKEDAILVNTARNEVINEDDLCAFMEQRTDVKYLSDIAPDGADAFADKFTGRCYFTPKKIGAQTQEANTNAGVAAAEQIAGFFENGDETFRVNR
ncbi:NAD(P)-dependent oxidoreductase [Mangrovibacterium lignilyticum]|uniref:NAD(P)-dependent oxidoreductase n=1 Tax=Mangrovibacterium lignilyticum TaxID=2668052 RepID=UPI0013D432C9|nr:NAD(P)-dependent oxidoreductase [Mangrovibacterium lignilyticum]